MTEERLPAELLAKVGDGDFLRSVAEAVVQLLMETDVEGVIGADRDRSQNEIRKQFSGLDEFSEGPDWVLIHRTRPHAEVRRPGGRS